MRSASQGAPSDQGWDPVTHLVMEEILEKLKMLDYEEHFKSFRPLTHTYFAMPSANPNEQFYYFTSLVSWLLSLLGQHLWRRLRSGVTQRSESARMWSDHQCLGGNGPCRREKGGSPAFLKSCVCAPPLKRPVGDQLQLRNARATWPARPAMSCRDPTDDACAVARHAEHVEGRGGGV